MPTPSPPEVQCCFGESNPRTAIHTCVHLPYVVSILFFVLCSAHVRGDSWLQLILLAQDLPVRTTLRTLGCGGLALQFSGLVAGHLVLQGVEGKTSMFSSTCRSLSVYALILLPVIYFCRGLKVTQVCPGLLAIHVLWWFSSWSFSFARGSW